VNDKMKPVYCLAIVYDTGAIYIDSTLKTEVQLSALLETGAKASIKRVKVAETKEAALTARALFHVWCQQLSGFTGEDPNATKQGLKIKFGFPIIMQDPEDGPILINILKALNWSFLDWGTKVKLTEKFIPVTSILDSKPLKQMMDNVKQWAMNEYNIELDNGKRGQ